MTKVIMREQRLIKGLLGALACLMILTLPVAADSGMERAKQLFNQAAELYRKGDYEGSVSLNEQALATGFESAAIHYNLGNGYLRSRKVGKAIASYQRAQRLAPGDVDVLANLGYARSLVPAAGSSPKRPFWLMPFERFSFFELRWCALGVLVFVATFILIGLYAGWKRRKIIGWGFAGALLFSYVLIGTLDRLSQGMNLGVCIKNSEVKFEPSGQATTYFKLPEGTEVRVLRIKEGWAKVVRPDGRTGWAPATAVERI